jgi:hypothetical protein
MLDDRAGVSKTFPLQFQEAGWTGNFDQLDSNVVPTEIGYMQGITIGGNGVTQANGEIATVYFAIDAGYNGLLVNSWDNGAFNGMQLRTIGLTADYDGNGSVGPEDYAVWKAKFGTTDSSADGNLDGVVDAADYAVWRKAVNAGSGASAGGLNSAAVPEPSAMLLCCMAFSFMGSTLSRRRRSPLK